MSKTIAMEVPTGWGDDKLTEFFGMARDNSFASFAKLRAHFSKLVAIDSAFLQIGENLHHPQAFWAPFFLMKSHSSFRAAAWMAMTGQSPEAFMVMRGCIESTLYGLFLSRNPASGDIYMNRHDDEAAKKAVRKEFTIAKMFECLRSVEPTLEPIASALYERTIDAGAHPNIGAIAGATRVTRTPDKLEIKLAYLSADPGMNGGNNEVHRAVGTDRPARLSARLQGALRYPRPFRKASGTPRGSVIGRADVG